MSDEQNLVAAAAFDARILVTAGPGTGKTFTLVARLLHLIDEEGLAPGAEILVLSFSRAAVREVRRRVAGHGSASYVRAMTFDSFATRLLAEVEPEGTWQQCSFDPRIERATAAIRDGKADGSLEDVRHIVIDEAQDLVGVRADLVAALLSRNVGFTVFGDPAQGIYDFQLSDPELRRLGSALLYRWIRDNCHGLVERSLTINFRARSESAKSALAFGALLNSRDPDFAVIRRGLETALMSATTLGDVDAAASALRRTDVRTAILCRTNGEALLVSERLHEARISHRVRPSSTDRQVGRWLAETLAMSAARVQSRRAVLVALTDVDLPDGLTPDDTWRLLKRLEPRTRRSTDDLDLANVAAKIRS
ncbi:MAG TPA: UvrD-helicase domain-containing protein, partial [Acidimicrobiales bacterium]|nr:UvrD-helicase domain-containing protein [Acidimicrobiales bacterium]